MGGVLLGRNTQQVARCSSACSTGLDDVALTTCPRSHVLDHDLATEKMSSDTIRTVELDLIVELFQLPRPHIDDTQSDQDILAVEAL
jgi:hypothetical protein